MQTLDPINPYASPGATATVSEPLDDGVIHAYGPVTFEEYRRNRLSYRVLLLHYCSFSFLSSSLFLANCSLKDAFVFGFGTIAIVFAILCAAGYLLDRVSFKIQAEVRHWEISEDGIGLDFVDAQASVFLPFEEVKRNWSTPHGTRLTANGIRTYLPRTAFACESDWLRFEQRLKRKTAAK